jgi:hypothetical protein
MRNWEQSLEPKIAQARDELRARDPREFAERSGAVYYEVEESQGRLQVRFFGQPYTVTWPDLEIFDPKGQSCSNPVQAVLLQYLVLADGTPLAQSLGLAEGAAQWGVLRASFSELFGEFSRSCLQERYRRISESGSSARRRAHSVRGCSVSFLGLAQNPSGARLLVWG